MAYDEGLAERIRDVLADETNITEKKMFGGLSFLLNGNMSVGIIKDELIVRVHPDEAGTFLDKPHARPMDFTGRPMKGWIYISTDGISDDQDLADWIRTGVTYAASLPPK